MAKDPIDLIIDDIFDAIFDSNWVGRHGENLTVWELRLVKFFGRDGKILRNVYVPKENGETSEIDVLFITQKGIFVLESKNYSGWIFGDEKSTYWTAVLPNRMKNRFYNPIMQNRTHIKWLNQFLGGEVPLFSMVVFSERCELKKVTVDSDDVYVIKRDMTYAAIREVWKRKPDILQMLGGVEYFFNFLKFGIAFFSTLTYNSLAGRDTLYTHDIELTFKRYVISSIMRPPSRWLF